MRERPWLWWSLVAALAAVHLVPALAAPREGGGGGAPQMRAMARYAVGVSRMDQARGIELLQALEGDVASWRDRVRFAAVEGEVAGVEAVLERIAELREAGPPGPEARDLDALEAVYAGRALGDDERARLRRRHGWFADLALTRDFDASDPRRREVIAPAVRTAAAFSVAAIGALGGLVAGVVLLLTWARRRVRGAWTDLLRPLPRREGDTALLETVGVFLAALLVAGTLLPLAFVRLLGASAGPWLYLFSWLAVPALLWPLGRGFDRARWRADLGLHGGAGLLREAWCGVVGYVAALPLLAVGFAMSAWLTNALGRDASHPLVQEVARGSVFDVVVLYSMACVWAPLAEEAVFRGALYRYLRGVRGRLASGLFTALLFAALHPQGLGAVPVLASLALAFALLREWRGSLVPCVTAHALHNALFVTFAITALR